ncbi:ATP-binding protein [Paenibacillus glycanilyticus]|uniref:sensor histidine kinase n=1 Tax=Paenibacillus glycanilyticus TaxID=126569 RepID=UPI00203B561D|nr:ATP-binding protein [Paenibacillus glycanilyticus]MCM3631620.1 ATP-binding protein [Paenibacillus glycanilyticus]
MNKRLHTRLAFIIIGTAVCILLISTVSVLWAAHYHISMFHDQAAGMNHDVSRLDYHLEQALIQSIIWTFAGSIALAIFIGFYIAKRISKPLVDMKKAAEHMSNGQLDMRIAISGDDELAELGLSLNELAAQLHKQEQLRVIMTEDIAHELRTPLATLKSHMRAFEDGIWEPTPERIHACYEEIERLTKMVAELEDLTHLDSPAFQLERKQESLNVLIQQVVEIVSAAYLEKEVKLSFRCNQHILIFSDYNRMTQILVNLLSNALKFTPSNGQVHVEAYEEGHDVLIRVHDSGSGIENEDIPYIFERFYRADKSRNRRTGGSGLGLSIVKKLVTAHGGQVWAENKDGAVITIRLPKKYDLP